MAYIKVNYSKFESVASEIDDFLDSVQKNTQNADTAINTLSANWQGSDFSQFKSQWDQVTNNDSAHYKFISALEAYSKYLRYAAKKYKEAQIKAINRANSLPK